MSTATAGGFAAFVKPRALPFAAGVYVAAWLAGLATAPSAPKPDATDATIQIFYQYNGAAALRQATLVHGIAGVALAVFVIALAHRLAAADSVLMVAGVGAAAVSLVQYGLEVALVRVADGGRLSTSATLFHAVNVADTLKLVLLAVAVAAATRLAAAGKLVPRWLAGLGYALAPILVFGGAAFLVTSDALNAVLAVSLLLLLVWVTAVAVVLTRRRPAGPAAPTG